MTGKEILETVVDLYNATNEQPEQVFMLLDVALKDKLINPAEQHKAKQYLTSLTALRTGAQT